MNGVAAIELHFQDIAQYVQNNSLPTQVWDPQNVANSNATLEPVAGEH